MCALTVLCWVLPGTALSAGNIGVAKRVVNDVTTQSFGQSVQPGDDLVAAETVVTRNKSAIDIRLTDQSTVMIGENSELLLDELVYGRDENKVTGAFRMVSGAIRFASSGVPMDFLIKTPTATIGIRGTQFDVLVDRDRTEVAVIEGLIQVQSRFGVVDVGTGQIYQVSTQQAVFLQTQSAQMQSAMQFILAMLQGSGSAPVFQTQQAGAAMAQVVALPSFLVGRDMENLLVIDLPQGKVYVELMPGVAPLHVRRIKQLVRQQFYDGLAFHYVRQDYVAETGDPSYTSGGAGGGGSGTTLAAEFSATPFTEGTVGMSRLQNDPNSADSRFFIALGPTARTLDGKYTAWGRVVLGMQYLKALKAANKPSAPERIRTIRVVSDLYK
ncbi:MAG: peptidylprolyl isomerase [Rhodospirillales bacterium]